MYHKSSTTKHGSLNDINYELDQIIIQAFHSISRNLPVNSQFNDENNSIDSLLMDMITKEVRKQKSIFIAIAKQKKASAAMEQSRIENELRRNESLQTSSALMRIKPNFISTADLTSNNQKEEKISTGFSLIHAALNRNSNYSPPSIKDNIGIAKSLKIHSKSINQATEYHSSNNRPETNAELVSKDFKLKEKSLFKIKVTDQQKDPEIFSYLQHKRDLQFTEEKSRLKSIIDLLLQETADGTLGKYFSNDKSIQQSLAQAQGISSQADTYDIETIVNMENKLKSILAILAKKKANR